VWSNILMIVECSVFVFNFITMEIVIDGKRVVVVKKFLQFARRFSSAGSHGMNHDRTMMMRIHEAKEILSRRYIKA